MYVEFPQNDSRIITFPDLIPFDYSAECIWWIVERSSKKKLEKRTTL